MRSVIISVVLLLAVCIGITVAYTYTRNTVDELIEITSVISFEEATDEDIENIKNVWDEKQNILVCLYDYRDIENVEASLLRLQASFSGGDRSEFLMNKAEFIHCVNRLKESSSLSLKNII